MDDDSHACHSSRRTRRKTQRMRWKGLLKVLENESQNLIKQSAEIETRLKNCRVKMRLFRLTSHIATHGTKALSSNRPTRNTMKRKVQELKNPKSDDCVSKNPTKGSTNAGKLWTPRGDKKADGVRKPAPCYVPPVSTDDVDELNAFNFRGDDSMKRILEKPTADVNQYGWGSFKVRLMYHFLYPEINRPVEQIFELDFIVNQISGFERIAKITVCNLDKDAIKRLRTLHSDIKHTITSSESEEDKSPTKKSPTKKSPTTSIKKSKSFEDEECMGDGILFDDIFPDNDIASDPYSGVLFSSDSFPEISFNNPDQSSLTDELINQSLNESSQPSAIATVVKVENSSQSIFEQSDTISDLSPLNKPKSSEDDSIKTELSLPSSHLQSSHSSVESCDESGYGSQSVGLDSDPPSLDLLETFSDDRKTIASHQNSAPCSSESASKNNTTSGSLECSAMSNISHLKRENKLKTLLLSDIPHPSQHTPQNTESECRDDSKNSSPKIIGSDQKPLKISETCRSNQGLASVLSLNPKTPSNNSSSKPIFVQAQGVNSDGKILIKHDGKSKLIRIIKAGSTSLLRKPQNSVSIPKPIPTSNLVSAPNQKLGKVKSCHDEGNMKGELSRKIEEVRQAVSGLEFEEALIYCLKNYPIVTKQASSKIYKQFHPYASKSNEEFLSWKFGKRAASMTKHARFIHGILIENCKGKPWSWAQVRQYAKYHGYVPVAKISGVYNPCLSYLSVTKTSLTRMQPLQNMTELRKLEAQMEEDNCEVDVDTIQPNTCDSRISSRSAIRSNDRAVEDFKTPEDFYLCQWIMKNNHMFKKIIKDDDSVPEILMSAFKSFAEYILRRSLAVMMTRKRKHNIIREKDVLTSVLFTNKLQILTEQGLGKIPVKCDIQYY
ncbi:hypothetical protein LSTR_LSTR007068 [Laodelphax striatellus]|uniref:YEATS domain-containing protein n=1 Tax=Laodelphax striatellus TaxID=195883 RepID=A0A482WK37_LAOST|nr:hypothetical protein LSTR_LSTR007068 [Laodelphax striatellus]